MKIESNLIFEGWKKLVKKRKLPLFGLNYDVITGTI